jgi:molybdopterin synthase catalytic subunit
MMSIHETALDPRAIEGRVRAPGLGGVVTFLGVVRDTDERGQSVAALEYEAYRSLVLAEFDTIAGEASARFGNVRIAIAHRVGRVAAGDIAVVVCAAAAHRKAAFAACEYAIDAVKARAPIWKRELYADGSAAWKANDVHA